jgi:octaprenyl-diphosphate synthase
MELFGHSLLKIHEALTRELDLYSWSEFYAPLRYACNGGKRIRPLILLLCAESIKGKTSNALTIDENDDMYMAASAIELHTESVIHDDIIDEEELRRGKPSFYVKYGYNNSILTADFVLGIILNIGSKIKNSCVSRELSRAAIKMTDGEIIEIKLCKWVKIEEDDYIKVLEHKTGSLFEASAKIGAILPGGIEDEIHAMARFGSLS